MKSVTVTLLGGMGNQMFQYALGRTLSVRTGLPLVVDRSMLRMRTPAQPARDYALGCFRLSPHRVRDLPFFAARYRSDVLRRFASIQFIDEQSLQFQPEVLQVNGPCQLQGYWQSERYFESIAAQLREDFTLLPPQGVRSAAYEARIRGTKSVAVNFRRKDFVGSSYHGTCSEQYYAAALDLVVEWIGRDIEIFVFSDEIEWCRQNVRYPFPVTFVDLEGQESDYELMRLMSACRALIGANSSFSWWSGWLNSHPDKLVIAPRKWYQAPGVVSDLPDSPWLIAL
jgi:hypothetical protein